ncbi:hypothetical protein [Brevibacterium litoralis]|uniref:hypothetical protein n=1 Tax=Brevibacterium litoralis TaxID=3138935 RepID=UPI0032F01228
MDDYVRTVTMPFTADGTTIGLSGADIDTRPLENRLLPLYARADGPVVLTDYFGRVVTGTSTRYLPGETLPADVEPLWSRRFTTGSTWFSVHRIGE